MVIILFAYCDDPSSQPSLQPSQPSSQQPFLKPSSKPSKHEPVALSETYVSLYNTSASKCLFSSSVSTSDELLYTGKCSPIYYRGNVIGYQIVTCYSPSAYSGWQIAVYSNSSCSNSVTTVSSPNGCECGTTTAMVNGYYANFKVNCMDSHQQFVPILTSCAPPTRQPTSMPNTNNSNSTSSIIIIEGIIIAAVLVAIMTAAAFFYYYFYFYMRKRALCPFLSKNKNLFTMEQQEDVMVGGESLDEKPLLA